MGKIDLMIHLDYPPPHPSSKNHCPLLLLLTSALSGSGLDGVHLASNDGKNRRNDSSGLAPNAMLCWSKQKIYRSVRLYKIIFLFPYSVEHGLIALHWQTMLQKKENLPWLLSLCIDQNPSSRMPVKIIVKTITHTYPLKFLIVFLQQLHFGRKSGVCHTLKLCFWNQQR